MGPCQLSQLWLAVAWRLAPSMKSATLFGLSFGHEPEIGSARQRNDCYAAESCCREPDFPATIAIDQSLQQLADRFSHTAIGFGHPAICHAAISRDARISNRIA